MTCRRYEAIPNGSADTTIRTVKAGDKAHGLSGETVVLVAVPE